MSSKKPVRPANSSSLQPASPPTLGRIFSTFLLIGLQSFGGGSATFLLLYEACMKHGWMTDEEFITQWAICQISPGINLIKLTILVGRKLRGWAGVAVACSGLLVPSALVTLLMTAFYSLYKDLPVIRSAMRGILPATIGLSLAMSSNLGVPVFKAARKEGPIRFWLQALVVAAGAAVMALGWSSPLWIMLIAAGLTALTLTFLPVPPPSTAQSRPQ